MTDPQFASWADAPLGASLRHGEVPALQPLSWHLADPPPQMQPAAPGVMLLQIDCRAHLPPEAEQGLLATLCTSEQHRHLAYRLPDDRKRFLRSRAGLRILLADQLDCSAAAVDIAIGAHGKPFCPGGPQFNLSHSGDLILLALHPSSQVGVDVEQRRPGVDWARLAKRVFSKPQLEQLSQLPDSVQQEDFLAQWCAMEAQLKAAGTGFSGLDQWRETVAQSGGLPMRTWRLMLPQDYVGALTLSP
jgi:4'-phosphopantetheinyl transferase